MVRWPVPAWGAVGRGGARECSFFVRHVGVEIDLRRFDRLMLSQPQCDDGAVDAGVQEVHRGGATERVRRDLLVSQR